jgi:DNA-binding winged helix-turn-helix (wHTH) protein
VAYGRVSPTDAPVAPRKPMTSDSPAVERRWYQFGPFVVDSSKRLLWRNRVLVPLTSKAFEILLVLIRMRGRVVEKQELMETVWPRTAVEENTLTRHISTLRKVLEERPEQHEYILTVPGQGYAFVGDVIELDTRPSDLQQSVAGVPANGVAVAGPEDTGAIRRISVPESPRDAPEPGVAPAAPLPELSVQSSGSKDRPALRSSPASMVMIGTALALTAVTTAFVVAAFRVDAPRTSVTHRALRQFTFHGGLQKDAPWSPDGRRVAYTSEHGGNSDIWAQALGSPAPVQITSWPAEDSQPAWSPDGQSLAFRSERDSGGLYVVSARGGTPTRISTFGYRPQWSPNRTLILFSSSGHSGGVPKYYVVGVDGRPPRALRSDVLSEFRPQHIGWRPDGQGFSLWGRDRNNQWTFVTASLQEGPVTKSAIDSEVERRRIEAGLMLDRLDRFVWAPSGKYLYFRGPRARDAKSLAHHCRSKHACVDRRPRTSHDRHDAG